MKLALLDNEYRSLHEHRRYDMVGMSGGERLRVFTAEVGNIEHHKLDLPMRNPVEPNPTNKACHWTTQTSNENTVGS